ncbi:RNA polymerase subunit sigma-70 [Halobacteriales archaeon QS_1_68_20]|nr:MAG: RNA polymerase subunit sigma-70 [Halobacteriales archaeon QS_1_68_20]
MAEDDSDADALLSAVGFDGDDSVLTRRQAEVLALRERDVPQAAIAEELGTSRANVSSVEASARENVRRARETVAFAAALEAPVRARIEPGSDLFDVPSTVYEACDDAGVKVAVSSSELLRRVRETAPDAIQGDRVVEPLLVGVAADGSVQIRQPDE